MILIWTGGRQYKFIKFRSYTTNLIVCIKYPYFIVPTTPKTDKNFVSLVKLIFSGIYIHSPRDSWYSVQTIDWDEERVHRVHTADKEKLDLGMEIYIRNS